MGNLFDISALTRVDEILPFVFFWRFFINGGWIFFVVIILIMLWELRLIRLRAKYMSKVEWVMLAIDVPREIEPNLKAVEHIYSQFYGIAGSINWVEKYFKGKAQLYLSLELISMGGYIQFIVRTPVPFRDLVESAFYAQYPQAEITEVEDYIDELPSRFPDKKYEMYGSGISFNKPNPYPIKTYTAFEHSLSQQLADPMASLLEIMSKIKPGEFMCIQMVVRPKDATDWIDEGNNIVNKLIGEKVESKPLLGPMSGVMKGTYETITASLVEPGAEEKPEKKQDQKNWMMQLTPGERSTVEQIQIKMSKKAYETKFRYIYVAEKEILNKGLGVSGFFGALNQFAAMDMNSFRPDKRSFTVDNQILFKNMRFRGLQNRLIRNYKKREPGAGIILNTEELASVFHFPTIEVKAPLVRKIDSRRSEPPSALPVEGVRLPLKPVASSTKAEAPLPLPTQAQTAVSKETPQTSDAGQPQSGQPPSNLPFE